MEYLRISDGVVGNKLFIVLFSQLNCNLRNIICSSIDNVQDDDYVIYSPNGNTVNALGKFSFDTEHISNSKYYSFFIECSKKYCNIDPTLSFEKVSCMCVKNCIFDISLNDKQYLRRIFDYIVNYNGFSPDFLWMEDNDLLFYPIKGSKLKTFASHYFSLMLYNIKYASK